MLPNAIEATMSTVRKTKRLTPEEEKELFKLAKTGDIDARNKIALSHMPFVVFLASKYQNSNIPQEDLISWGFRGLLRAVDNFYPNSNCKLISFAQFWIRYYILTSIVKNYGSLSLTVAGVQRLSKAKKMVRKLDQKLGRLASNDDTAKESGIDCLELANLSLAYSSAPHLEASINGTEMSLYEIVPDKNGVEPDKEIDNSSLKEVIETTLIKLGNLRTGRSEISIMEVIALYFGLLGYDRHTLEEIAEQFGITKQRAQQIKERGLKLIRKSDFGPILKEYLQ